MAQPVASQISVRSAKALVILKSPVASDPFIGNGAPNLTGNFALRSS
jgi:hypothetical protein